VRRLAVEAVTLRDPAARSVHVAAHPVVSRSNGRAGDPCGARPAEEVRKLVPDRLCRFDRLEPFVKDAAAIVRPAVPEEEEQVPPDRPH